MLLVLPMPWKGFKTIYQEMSKNLRILYLPIGFALEVTAFSLRWRRRKESLFIVSFIVEKLIAKKEESHAQS